MVSADFPRKWPWASNGHPSHPDASQMPPWCFPDASQMPLRCFSSRWFLLYDSLFNDSSSRISSLSSLLQRAPLHDSSWVISLPWFFKLVYKETLFGVSQWGHKLIFWHDWMVWAWLQALEDVVERPTGVFFVPRKWGPWNFETCLLSCLMFLVNIWS